MRPASTRYLDAITKTHTLAVEVQILDNDEPVGDPLTAIGNDEDNSVTAGTVTLDAKAETRGRAELTLVDDGRLGLVPSVPSDRLAPYGREMWVKRGILYPDGASDLISLGKFRIDDTNVDSDAANLTIAISGMDRSKRISDAKFQEPYNVAAGTNVAEAILTIVQTVYPTVQTNFVVTDVTTPKLIAEEQADRWRMCQEMATAAGMRLFFDGDGVLVLAPEAFGDAVVTLAEGESGVLLTAGRSWSRQGSFNIVIATGENTGETAPSRGVAQDDNPLSPTYIHGAFGPVPYWYQSQFIRTDAQALQAAQTILDRELGTTQTVRLGTLVLPHLEPGDVAHITRLRAGVDESHILDSLTIPLTHDGIMTGATRAKVVQS